MQTKLCYIISKLATKVGNLELKINMPYVRQAKLSRMTRKLPKLENRMGFSKLEGRNPLQ
jgi:hypothetical protein